MSRKHSGGTLADIGCHILDFTTYVVGDIASLHCSMKSFPKGVPRNTCKGYKLDADDSFFTTAEFASGALGVIHATRWATGHANFLRLRVFGDRGALVVDSEAGTDKLQRLPGEVPRAQSALGRSAGEGAGHAGDRALHPRHPDRQARIADVRGRRPRPRLPGCLHRLGRNRQTGARPPSALSTPGHKRDDVFARPFIVLVVVLVLGRSGHLFEDEDDSRMNAILFAAVCAK